MVAVGRGQSTVGTITTAETVLGDGDDDGDGRAGVFAEGGCVVGGHKGAKVEVWWCLAGEEGNEATKKKGKSGEWE